MSDLNEFEKFKPIPRLFRDCVITEKIDGTNAQISIRPLITTLSPTVETTVDKVVEFGDAFLAIRAGSRNRWLAPGKGTDNHGFAAWVHDNVRQLVELLGIGRHYGEWWGQGIQRGYGMDHKRFELFNVHRWRSPDGQIEDLAIVAARAQGVDIGVVPVLYRGSYLTEYVDLALYRLETEGSRLAPCEGFPKPEGVVVYHSKSGQLYKATIENDDQPKSVRS